jgi:hypothetical protein
MVRLQVQHCADQSLAVFPAYFGDFRYPIEHQHRRKRQLRTFAEQFTAAAGKEILVFEMRLSGLHCNPGLEMSGDRRSPNTGYCRGKVR